MQNTISTIYLNSKNDDCAFQLENCISNMLKENLPWDSVVIVCIGSDRSTGDSLGPLVGYKLKKYNLKQTHIYGTLENPIHAGNIETELSLIYQKHAGSFVIAIDASLGKKEHLGFVTLSPSPLKPGLGVKKELPPVGDAHITGIVNLSGSMETLLLQTTRLSNVMLMADTISKALMYSLSEI